MKTITDHLCNIRPFKPATLAAALTIGLLLPGIAWSDISSGRVTAPLKPDVPYIFISHQGRSIRIERDIDNSFKAGTDIRGELTQTSGTCPPFCLQPLQLDVPVDTVAEAEIVDFMLMTMRNDKGVLVDVRSKKSFDYNTIPGSVNYFIGLINKGPGNKEFDAMLEKQGAMRREQPGWLTRQLENTGLADTSMLTEEWDFTAAKVLIVWATSATDSSAASAIKALLSAGYPAEKLKWYRGGMAAWQYWGFTTVRTPTRN